MSDNSDLNTEITMSEYDVREQQHRHKMESEKAYATSQVERAKYEHKTARQNTIKVVGVAAVAASLIFGVVFLIWKAESGPDEGAAREQQREEACVTNGGGWVPEDLLATASHGLCVYPGERAG